jgi:ribose transport system permease protein
MRKSYKNFLKSGNIGLIIGSIVLIVILSFSAEGFLTSYNLFNLGRNIGIYIIIGLAQAVVLIIGDLNLSVGAIGGLSIITVGYFLVVLKTPSWVGVVAALFVGATCGFINGVLTAKGRINAFIVTLATLFIFNGIKLGITKGSPYVGIPQSFTIMGQGSIFNIPYVLIFMIVVLILIYIFFNYNVLGRRMLAVGDSRDAASFVGLNIDKHVILAHALSGFLAGLGGILYVSRIGSSQPQSGEDWLLISFAIAIIGGTSLSGGRITSFGLFLGALIMVVINNALIMLKVNIYWESTVLGAIILLAVAIDLIRKIMSNKRVRVIE